MSEVQKRLSYTVSYKLNVIDYAKKHGNRAAEKHFGPPPTEKMIREWRKQEEQLKVTNKDKRTFRSHVAKWPQLEVELKNWITNNRSMGLAISTKMIICEGKRLATANGISDFVGSSSWCHRFMKRHGLCMRRKTQKMPTKSETDIIDFHKFVISTAKKYSLLLENDHFMSVGISASPTSDDPSND